MALVRQFGNFGLGDADLVNTWLFYTVLVVGFYFVFGVSGQFAFSQAAFAAVGGYTSAWATREEVFGTDTFWVGLIAGVVVACVIAAVFAFFMRRASEFYLAIATLGLVGDHPRGPPPLDRLHRLGRRHHGRHPADHHLRVRDRRAERVPHLLGVVGRGRAR